MWGISDEVEMQHLFGKSVHELRKRPRRVHLVLVSGLIKCDWRLGIVMMSGY